MPLTKSKGNMYPWVTHTHTHLGGECPHRCTYCYVQAMERRFAKGRYTGPLRLIEDEFKVQYGSCRRIFVEHCNDLWAEIVSAVWIDRVLKHCHKWPNNEFVFQTKNPARFEEWLGSMPLSRWLGCTIESAWASRTERVSAAPPPIERYQAMKRLRAAGERLFVTVEPILEGDMVLLARWIADIKPEFVNIGADPKGTGLDEPNTDSVRRLLAELARNGVEIRQKRNLRL